MTLRPTPFPSLPYKTISRCRCNVGVGRAPSLLCEMYRKYELTCVGPRFISCVGPRFIFGVKTHEFCLIELPLYPSDIGLRVITNPNQNPAAP